MTIDELNELTREDLIILDRALIVLARYEHNHTKNTIHADRATKILNRIAVRYGLVSPPTYVRKETAS